jgi:WD40 repeat protein
VWTTRAKVLHRLGWTVVSGALLFVRPSATRDKTFLQHALEAKEIWAADISPDNRFLAAYRIDFGNPKLLKREIQVWDWQKKEVVIRKAISRDPRPSASPPTAAMENPESFVRYVGSGEKLAFYDDGHILVFDSKTLDLLKDVDLQAAQWPQPRSIKLPTLREMVSSSYVADLEVTSAAARAAVFIRHPGYESGELRVYDLDSGRLLRAWSFINTASDVTDFYKARRDSLERPIAIDSSGQLVAISLGELRPMDNSLPTNNGTVLVLDIATGQLGSTFRTGSSLGDSISFDSGLTPSLFTLSIDSGAKKASGAIQVWESASGKLLRQIPAPNSAQGYIDPSEDGRTILVYLLDVKNKVYPLGMESGLVVAHRKLAILDSTTGKIKAITPDFWPGQWIRHPRYRLSPKGDLVLAYRQLISPLYVFEIP